MSRYKRRLPRPAWPAPTGTHRLRRTHLDALIEDCLAALDAWKLGRARVKNAHAMCGGDYNRYIPVFDWTYQWAAETATAQDRAFLVENLLWYGGQLPEDHPVFAAVAAARADLLPWDPVTVQAAIDGVMGELLDSGFKPHVQLLRYPATWPTELASFDVPGPYSQGRVPA